MKRRVFCENCQAPKWINIAFEYIGLNELDNDNPMYAIGVCPDCGTQFKTLAKAVGEHYLRNDIDYGGEDNG